MFIAMNRFKVFKNAAEEFEAVWKARDSHLDEMTGFQGFLLLRGPATDDHVLYSSHTTWRSKADFEAWTKSEQFRKAHSRAPGSIPLFDGHPQFEGFESVQELKASVAKEAAE